jgi:hypothetical protein
MQGIVATLWRRIFGIGLPGAGAVGSCPNARRGAAGSEDQFGGTGLIDHGEDELPHQQGGGAAKSIGNLAEGLLIGDIRNRSRSEGGRLLALLDSVRPRRGSSSVAKRVEPRDASTPRAPPTRNRTTFSADWSIDSRSVWHSTRGRRGGSYGSSMPARCVNSPERARL